MSDRHLENDVSHHSDFSGMSFDTSVLGNGCLTPWSEQGHYPTN